MRLTIPCLLVAYAVGGSDRPIHAPAAGSLFVERFS